MVQSNTPGNSMRLLMSQKHALGQSSPPNFKGENVTHGQQKACRNVCLPGYCPLCLAMPESLHCLLFASDTHSVAQLGT